MRRFAVCLALGALWPLVAGLPAAATPDEEVLLIELVNDSRAAAGLPVLEADVALIVAGRGHSAAMASVDELYHSTRGELATYAADWELMGENVGRGPNIGAIHEAFMESPSHRGNVLGDFDAVGVGVERSVDGTLFVTVIFVQRTPDAEPIGSDAGPVALISGLPEFAVSRLMAAAEIFERSGRDLCSPAGSGGFACVD